MFILEPTLRTHILTSLGRGAQLLEKLRSAEVGATYGYIALALQLGIPDGTSGDFVTDVVAQLVRAEKALDAGDPSAVNAYDGAPAKHVATAADVQLIQLYVTHVLRPARNLHQFLGDLCVDSANVDWINAVTPDPVLRAQLRADFTAEKRWLDAWSGNPVARGMFKALDFVGLPIFGRFYSKSDGSLGNAVFFVFCALVGVIVLFMKKGPATVQNPDPAGFAKSVGLAIFLVVTITAVIARLLNKFVCELPRGNVEASARRERAIQALPVFKMDWHVEKTGPGSAFSKWKRNTLTGVGFFLHLAFLFAMLVLVMRHWSPSKGGGQNEPPIPNFNAPDKGLEKKDDGSPKIPDVPPPDPGDPPRDS